MGFGTGGYGAMPWGDGAFPLTPPPPVTSEYDVTPDNGETGGGTEVSIIGPGLSMAGCLDDFADSVIDPALWSVLTTGTGSAAEIGGEQVVELDSGTTAGSTAAIQALGVAGDIDASMRFRATAVSLPFATSRATLASLKLYAVLGTEFRVSVVAEGNARYLEVLATQAGVPSLDVRTVIGSFNRAAPASDVTLRLLRAASRVYVFLNGTQVTSADWVSLTASVVFGVENDPTDPSRARVRLSDYGRRPVIRFGSNPMTEFTFQGRNRVSGLTPAASSCRDSNIDVAITVCSGIETVLPDGFTYFSGLDRIRMLDGRRQFIVCTDPVLRRRR